MAPFHQKTELTVRAIMIYQNRILVNTWKDGYSFLPGGKVKHGETLSDALEREIYEELRVQVRFARLTYLIENFYEQSGKSVHELGFYYRITCDDSVFNNPEEIVNPDDDDLRFELISIAGLKSFDVRPSVIRDSIGQDFENQFDLAPYHLVSRRY